MNQRLPGKLGVLQALLATGLVPNFHSSDLSIVRGAVSACVDAGCPVFEYTNRGDGALSIFEGLAVWSRDAHPTLVLGAGTITEPATAVAYINAGATFIVGPNFHPDVARACNRRGVLYIPGCATPSEISNALEAGAAIVKLFPAGPLGGPAFVRAILGPFSHALIMASGGIETDEAHLRDWFDAGVACVSIGSNLFPSRVPGVVGSDKMQAVRAVVEAIRRVRS